jgi:hypothetical protein
MKQILILEPHEIERLQRGRTLLISTPQGEIALQFEKASTAAASGPEDALTLKCNLCGTTTRKDGKPFHSHASVIRHKVMVHGMRAKGGTK